MAAPKQPVGATKRLVAQLMVNGKNANQISKIIGVTPQSAQYHVNKIKKLTEEQFRILSSKGQLRPRALAQVLGEKTYTTSKPCANGNLAPRHTNNANCTCTDCKIDRKIQRLLNDN